MTTLPAIFTIFLVNDKIVPIENVSIKQLSLPEMVDMERAAILVQRFLRIST